MTHETRALAERLERIDQRLMDIVVITAKLQEAVENMRGRSNRWESAVVAAIVSGLAAALVAIL